MTEHPQENLDVPVWARDDAFPVAPPGWGWLDARRKPHPCASLETLTTAIRDDRDGSVTLVWAPGHERMILPEELEGMADALKTARERWTREDLNDAMGRLKWFGTLLGGLVIYTFLTGFLVAGRFAAQTGAESGFLQRVKFALAAVFNSTQCGLVLLMFVIFAFLPWYQARKRRNEMARWTEAGMAEAVPTIRFESWLEGQRAPVTKLLFVGITLVALAQILCRVPTEGLGSIMSVFQVWNGIPAAGLVKQSYLHGEWWRLFTAPMLHGNLLHFAMNMSALAYLGKRLEVFARWPHLPLVFVFAACIGGEASARFVAAPSVGASGGLMGWLGFLLVFETLHKRLVPRRARRRLAAGVVLTALIGVIGYRFIDNAAHAGGLLAGMVYAAIVFPASSSPNRPHATVVDFIAGSAALLVLGATSLLAVWKIMAANGG